MTPPTMAPVLELLELEVFWVVVVELVTTEPGVRTVVTLIWVV
jgi:hypothetical protein